MNPEPKTLEDNFIDWEALAFGKGRKGAKPCHVQSVDIFVRRIA